MATSITCAGRREDLRDPLLRARRRAADTTARLRFRAGGQTRARLAAVVAAEARCCPFLAFDLADDDDAIVLTIAAPADAAATLVMDELVDAFADMGEGAGRAAR